MYLLTFLIALSYRSTLSINIKVHWWQNKPYIYKENGTIRGVLHDFATNVASNSQLCNEDFNVEYDDPLPNYQRFNELHAQVVSNKTKWNDSKVHIFMPSYFHDPTGKYVMIAVSPGLTFVYWATLNNKLYRAFTVGVERSFLLLGIAAAALIIVGILLWIVEHQFNKTDFSGRFYKGAFDGMYLAIITMTTVGYGDKVPKTAVGKLIITVWILLCVIQISIFTAMVTSGATEENIDLDGEKVAYLVSGKFRGPAELLIRAERGIPVAVHDNNIAYEKVKGADVFTALLDTYNVAAYQDEISKYFIEIGKSYQQDVKIYALMKQEHYRRYKPFWKCLESFSLLFKPPSLKRRRELGFKESIAALQHAKKPILHIVGAISGALIAVGILCDLFVILGRRRKRKKSDFRGDNTDQEMFTKEKGGDDVRMNAFESRNTLFGDKQDKSRHVLEDISSSLAGLTLSLANQAEQIKEIKNALAKIEKAP